MSTVATDNNNSTNSAHSSNAPFSESASSSTDGASVGTQKNHPRSSHGKTNKKRGSRNAATTPTTPTSNNSRPTRTKETSVVVPDIPMTSEKTDTFSTTTVTATTMLLDASSEIVVDLSVSPSSPSPSSSSSHPLLTLLLKKARAHRKKLEKIKVLEDDLARGGKVLNDQQRNLTSQKPVVEKLLSEVEALVEACVEGDKEMVLHTAATIAAALSTAKNDDSRMTHTLEVVPETTPLTSETNVITPLLTLSESTQTEMIMTQETDMETETMETIMTPVTTTATALDAVSEILKLMHAVTLCQALGQPIPSPLDFLVKVLLGTTRPPAEVSFDDNLASSMDTAALYLSQSETIVACDMSYKELTTAVSLLIAPPTLPVEVLEVEDPEVNVFNFFTESLLEAPADSSPVPNLSTSRKTCFSTLETTSTMPEALTDHTSTSSLPTSTSLPLKSTTFPSRRGAQTLQSTLPSTTCPTIITPTPSHKEPRQTKSREGRRRKIKGSGSKEAVRNDRTLSVLQENTTPVNKKNQATRASPVSSAHAHHAHAHAHTHHVSRSGFKGVGRNPQPQGLVSKNTGSSSPPAF